jgi:RimJ/RimL family protein N-acetyltransferase
MTDIVDIPCPLGRLTLRPERDDDRDFRYRLFCDSRLPEWYRVELPPQVREQLMQHQFHAQTVSYRQFFPRGRFDIVELDGEPIGRIVVDRPSTMIYIVDQAIVPQRRNQGVGTAIVHSLMDEAARAGLPVRLKVADTNDPSMRLYLRLGFVVASDEPVYIDMEWRAG